MSGDDIARLAQQVSALAERVARIEGRLDERRRGTGPPTTGRIDRIEAAVAELADAVRVTAEALKCLRQDTNQEGEPPHGK